MINALAQLGAKAEGTEGTYNAPLVGDAALLVNDPKFELINPKTDVARRTSSFSKWPSVGKQKGGRITFDMDMYALDKTTLPKWDILFQACGLTATGGSGSIWVYGLKSLKSAIPAISLSLNVDGYVRKLAGCRGDVKWKFVAGMPIVASFTFEGALVAPSDTAFLAPTFDSTAKDLPHFTGATLSLTAISPATDTLTTSEAVLETLEISLGNTLFLSPSANSSTGFLSCTIVDREPKIMIDPEYTSVAVFDWIQTLTADQSFVFTTGKLIGYTALNTLQWDVPVAQYYGMSEEDRGGIKVAKAEFRPRRNAADNDEMTITLCS